MNEQPRFVVNHRRAGEIERLPEAARRVARLCDGLRTIDELAALSRLPAERAGQVVERLANLGIVFAVTEPPMKTIVRRRRMTPLTVQKWLSEPPVAVAASEVPSEVASELSAAIVGAPELVAAPAPVAEPAPVVVEPAPVVAEPPSTALSTLEKPLPPLESAAAAPLEPPPLEAPRPSLTLPPPPAPPVDAFDVDEESFFASPIDHLVGDDFFE